MKFIFTLWLIVLSTNVYSQNQETKDFIEAFYGLSAKIAYQTKISEYHLKGIKQALARDTLIMLGARFNNPNDQLVLTKRERSYVDDELRKQNEVDWNSDLLKNGKAINKSTIDSIFNDRYRDWAYFNQHYGSKLYSFSRPIFIRENSLCIFYSDYVCGSRCGEGKLMVFKKKGDTWVEWLDIFRWES